MIPIQDLLNRIRWDSEFGKGRFAIGYYDRLEDEIVVVPLSAIDFGAQQHGTFRLVDAQGGIHTIPLHRIKRVYKDGEFIWHRER